MLIALTRCVWRDEPEIHCVMEPLRVASEEIRMYRPSTDAERGRSVIKLRCSRDGSAFEVYETVDEIDRVLMPRIACPASVAGERHDADEVEACMFRDAVRSAAREAGARAAPTAGKDAT